MATLAFNPAALSVLIRTPGGAYSPPNIRAVTSSARQQATRQLTVNGANATLSLVGSAPWLSVPENSTDGEAFDVVVDAGQLPAAGDFFATIKASADGADDAFCVVSLAVRPEGPCPR